MEGEALGNLQSPSRLSPSLGLASQQGYFTFSQQEGCDAAGREKENGCSQRLREISSTKVLQPMECGETIKLESPYERLRPQPIFDRLLILLIITTYYCNQRMDLAQKKKRIYIGIFQ